MDLLRSAEDRRDVETVARIFAEYKPQLEVPQPPPVNPGQPIQPSVESQVVPQGHSVPPQAQQPQKKIYSAMEYKNEMTRVANMSPHDEHRKRLKQELDSAVQEGRIRP